MASLSIDPLLWPGVNNIEEADNVYILNTVLGEVKVSKASEIFKGTSSSYIFDKPLMGKCHSRSYEFIRENRDNYQVVLSYMPNLLFDGHYHAYLELGSKVLDIASNSYYFSREDSKKVLSGRIIKKLTYEEVEEEYAYLKEKYPDLQNVREHKLYILSLYHDFRDRL